MLEDLMTWEWQNIASGVAFVVSLAALLVSWLAYRQRVRYHPQPKLVLEWGKEMRPRDGLFTRDLAIVNHGDAAARDVRVDFEDTESDDKPWDGKDVLEPGARMLIDAPLVDRMSWGEGGMGITWTRSGDPSDYKYVTPRATVKWRQAPFGGRQHRLVERGPTTPDLRAGTTKGAR
ncbi:hypothetical protein [Agromyces sp. CCNWLW203]|uniref:hypothetical protein n=1 Tax=Agromyces sp. CCNWLW203 TaxID=3112842 RepID=UPI002F965D4F